MRTIWLAPPEANEHPAHVDLKITVDSDGYEFTRRDGTPLKGENE